MNNLTFAGGADAREECALHTHGGYEIIIFSGGGKLLTADGELACAPDSVTVVPPRTKHCAQFSGDGLRAVLEQALLPVAGITVLTCDKTSEIKQAVNNAQKYVAQKEEIFQPIIAAYGDLIASLIAAAVPADGFSPVVRSFMRDMDKHIGDSAYSPEIFMRTVPLNYDYVRKLFKKETGTTPHEYLTSARMKRARGIILSGVSNLYSDYTVSQIAEACGYAEPLYFSRVFKKYFNVAPSQYMQSVKGGTEEKNK